MILVIVNETRTAARKVSFERRNFHKPSCSRYI